MECSRGIADCIASEITIIRLQIRLQIMRNGTARLAGTCNHTCDWPPVAACQHQGVMTFGSKTQSYTVSWPDDCLPLHLCPPLCPLRNPLCRPSAGGAIHGSGMEVLTQCMHRCICKHMVHLDDDVYARTTAARTTAGAVALPFPWPAAGHISSGLEIWRQRTRYEATQSQRSCLQRVSNSTCRCAAPLAKL